MMTPEQAVFAAILVCIGGALLTLALARNRVAAGWLAFLFTTASAVLIFDAVAQVLAKGPSSLSGVFPIAPSVGFALRLHVDGLTATFLFLAALIALPASLYSINYMKHYTDYGVARYYPNLLLFLAAMYGLLSTTDMLWFFFVFWQMMTLPGYTLIRFEYRKPENVRAANKYLIMMQIACAATIAGAWLVADGGGNAPALGVKYDFDNVSANLPAFLAAQPGLATLAFALFLIGFGIKMGMWPFGRVWLPDAHPAAPSPVSALLSGVMIKTGVYGVMRYFLWLPPFGTSAAFPLATWGVVVTVLGTVTLFVGTMQALHQEQSKRLLAFHSIGQVGYILFGTGVCMVLLSVPGKTAPALAALALTGALFHTLNHGVFKGLLFLNAGSMLHATGTQNLNKMGGLLKFMPLTGVTALIASLSISGVPLFNGFASKWSLYSAAILGSHSAGWLGWLAVCAVIAILTSALTLASFMKFFGVSFLSRASDVVTAQAAERGKLEVGWTMQLPQLLLAAICVTLGVAPVIAFRIIGRVLDTSPHGLGSALAGTGAMIEQSWTRLEISGANAAFAPLVVLVIMAGLFVFVRFLSKLGQSQRRAAVPWLCGYAREAECNRYVAHNFYGEIKRYFHWLGGGAHSHNGTMKPPISPAPHVPAPPLGGTAGERRVV